MKDATTAAVGTVKPRLVWFDANRALAAVGVVLIHSTTDFSGGVFPNADPAERFVPVFLRSLAELSGSEMFFTFSLFLMAFKLDRRRPAYGEAIREQARRLLVPFAVWTLFYAFFRLIKATEFGYPQAIWAQLADPEKWLGYFVLGEAQYHMHFLPTLFLLFLFFPLMRLGQRFPLFGLVIIATLGVMQYAQGWIWGLGLEPDLRDYIIRTTKVLGYVGYGLAAFALFGLWKDGIPRGESRLLRRGAIYMIAIAYMATLPFFGAALFNGTWNVRQNWAYYGHFLMPLFVFLGFMASQYGNWSPRWSWFARYTFGVYLIHPLVIDLYDVAMHRAGLTGIEPWMIVISRFAVALPGAFLIAFALSKIPFLAWTIGLGPAPWERRGAVRD
ncbi:acyltransferase [Falsirhodobacter sp. 20TX0035]|uniref:acyltransferase n=1 Tax=Falsirhodobacter sp. 20TX0035 TaxID=3022019 RepID=UPI00232B0B74|nr:acyltransferase [Falsirhodobacter sp. 20TX0035]MDB6454760.1 acyltransferase [Falsirhodobacter sp. 20TX0035]